METPSKKEPESILLNTDQKKDMMNLNKLAHNSKIQKSIPLKLTHSRGHSALKTPSKRHPSRTFGGND